MKKIRLAAILVAGLLAAAYLFIEKAKVKEVDGYCRQGMELVYGRRYMEAKEYFEKALAVKPKSKEALADLGLCYEMMGWSREALACYKKAIHPNRREKER